MPFDSEQFMQELNSMSYDEVHLKLATDPTWYNYDPRRGIAQDWMRRKAEANAASILARSEARSEETLSIAKEANDIARSASFAASSAASAASEANLLSRSNRKIAIVAAVAAITSAAITAIKW